MVNKIPYKEFYPFIILPLNVICGNELGLCSNIIILAGPCVCSLRLLGVSSFSMKLLNSGVKHNTDSN